MSYFNLVDEEWIPCILPNGNSEDLRLEEVLIAAHKIDKVLDASPLVTDSLHRLLLAVLYSCYEISSMRDWQEIWKTGRFDRKRLKNYLQEYKPRFNLFDEKRPFYQSPELKGAKKHPALHLAMEISSGNNATLFNHSSDKNPDDVSPAIAARYVVTTQAYAIGFGVSHGRVHFSDSHVIRGLTVMALGNSLFETLALNLFPWPGKERGKPIWEQDAPAKPYKDGNVPPGYLDYMTWQSRNIHLFPEDNPLRVRFCQIQQNLRLPKQSIFDPFKCYRKDEKRGYVPLGISPEKAIWRNGHTLFQTVDNSYKRPEIFNWLARIEAKRHGGEIDAKPSYLFSVIGLATDTGKAGSVLLWRHERLPLPLKYLEEEALVSKLKEALDISESVGRLFLSGFLDRQKKYPRPFQILATTLLPLDSKGKPDQKAVEDFVKNLAPGCPYWAALGILFNSLMKRLADDESEERLETLSWWAGEVRETATAAFREAIASLDHNSRWLKAVTRVEDEFLFRLNTILKPYKQTIKKGGEDE